MLIKADYLNEEDLNAYIAHLEGGLRSTGSTTTSGASGASARLGIKVAEAKGRRESTSESSVVLDDVSASRLKRLIDAGHDDPESLGWVTILDSSDDFNNLGLGAMVEWECDVHVPELLELVDKKSEIEDLLSLYNVAVESGNLFGINAESPGMPNKEEQTAIFDVLDHLNLVLAVIGKDDEEDWKVVGSLKKEWVREGASFDGRFRVLGKVQRIVRRGKWYPLVSLPGMDALNRKQRRKIEKDGPEEGQEDNFVEGPAVVLDFLAIYR